MKRKRKYYKRCFGGYYFAPTGAIQTARRFEWGPPKFKYKDVEIILCDKVSVNEIWKIEIK